MLILKFLCILGATTPAGITTTGTGGTVSQPVTATTTTTKSESSKNSIKMVVPFFLAVFSYKFF